MKCHDVWKRCKMIMKNKKSAINNRYSVSCGLCSSVAPYEDVFMNTNSARSCWDSGKSEKSHFHESALSCARLHSERNLSVMPRPLPPVLLTLQPIAILRAEFQTFSNHRPLAEARSFRQIRKQNSALHVNARWICLKQPDTRLKTE